MVNLFPDRLASSGDNKFTKHKKHRIVPNILEWVRCFGLYISIISHNVPERVSELLGYQALIIDAYVKCFWLKYDRQFRQRAAVIPTPSWSSTIWLYVTMLLVACQVFKGVYTASVYPINHESANFLQMLICHQPPGHPLQDTTLFKVNAPSVFYGIQIRVQVAYARFTDSSTHVTYLRRRDNSVQNKNHKAIHCPYRIQDRPTRPQKPTIFC